MFGRLSIIYPSVFAIVFIAILFGDYTYADWPVYRGNSQRTGYRAQAITAKYWEPAWVNDALQPPAPAWPAPARGSLWQRLDQIEPRVIEDQGDVPLIALDEDGTLHLLVISSSMDSLRCLDPTTGQQRWQFFADGPIRYAPHVESGVIWLGSDDGILRAIELSNGKLRWSYRVGPSQPKVFGNGRLISSHPIRTSAVVVGNEVYAAAGLFPSQGVYVVSVDKEDGKCLWRRRIKQSPQGYLLVDEKDRLCIPCGRATPFCMDRQSGRFVCELPSAGGTFCMVTQEAFFSGPGNTAAVQSYPNLPQAKMLPIGGRAIAAGAGSLWFSSEGKLSCHDLKKMMARESLSENWSISSDPVDQLIVSGEGDAIRVFAASGAMVNVLNGSSGEVLQTLQLPSAEETVRYLAVSCSEESKAPEVLIATTSSGKIFAWHGVTDNPKRSWDLASAGSDKNESVTVPELSEGQITRMEDALSSIPATVGIALLVNDNEGSFGRYLAKKTDLEVVSLVTSLEDQERLRSLDFTQNDHGERATVLQHEPNADVPFSEPLFNLVFEASPSDFQTSELSSYAIPGLGVVCRVNEAPVHVNSLEGVGVWRHQYGTPANTSDSGDDVIGSAENFRLQWFGGVGPERMPDRHLRAHSPLAAGPTAVLHGDSCLIGIDPANGLERWQLDLPSDAMRYVMPFDGGYSCLTIDGRTLYTSVGRELWKIDAITGKRVESFSTPAQSDGMVWGYVAEHHGKLISSLMKPFAGRLRGEPQVAEQAESKSFDAETLRHRYTELDYGSSRPLVCSRMIHSVGSDGETLWAYNNESVIANSSISLGSKGDRLVMVESRNDVCVASESDRIAVQDLVRQAEVVCLNTINGEVLWKQPLPFSDAKNVLYSLICNGKVVLATSVSGEDRATYHLATISLLDGSTVWSASHEHVTNGLGHGEQVHHPLALRRPDGKRVLIAEPFLYDLETGAKLTPSGAEEDWALRRPGHSCGTLSGAGNCVFFRAGNPTVLNLAADPDLAFSKLSPSRPGCWINMLPAGGRLLIPEGSASCVCAFPVQTSMGFLPIRDGERELKILDDFPPLTEEPVELQYAWRFEKSQFQGGVFLPTVGGLELRPMEMANFSEEGLLLDGSQWLAVGMGEFDLPPMPATVSLEASVLVSKSGVEWSGILGAIQDNGDFERGTLLGIRDDQFFFCVASEQKSKMTYLQAPQAITLGERYHLLGTYDGKLMRFYINGKLQAVSAAQVGPLLFEQKSPLVAGIYKDDNDHLPFQGTLMNAAVFRGAVEPEEVQRRAADLLK